jgi:hypothetical protein
MIDANADGRIEYTEFLQAAKEARDDEAHAHERTQAVCEVLQRLSDHARTQVGAVMGALGASRARWAARLCWGQSQRGPCARRSWPALEDMHDVLLLVNGPASLLPSERRSGPTFRAAFSTLTPTAAAAWTLPSWRSSYAMRCPRSRRSSSGARARPRVCASWVGPAARDLCCCVIGAWQSVQLDNAPCFVRRRQTLARALCVTV